MTGKARATNSASEVMWDVATIRRAIQLLGAHEARSGDVSSIARAMRYIWDFLQRRGIPTEIFQLPGLMPLIIAGTGPIMVVSSIDSNGVRSSDGNAETLEVTRDSARGAGIVRKSGVLAAIGSLLNGNDGPITLIIEADRTQGSAAIEAWLRTARPDSPVALVESDDLPIPVPACFRGATGSLMTRIVLCEHVSPPSAVFRSVLQDTGHELAQMLSALKSRDAEVLLPTFYDDIPAPDQATIETLHAITPSIEQILHVSDAPIDLLPAAHLTLGLFIAPSLTIREVCYPASTAKGLNVATATIDIRLMPGQSVAAIEADLQAFLSERFPAATLEPLLRRAPASGLPDLTAEDVNRLGGRVFLPVAPGLSPAGLLEEHGIPTLGFQTVSPGTTRGHEEVLLSDIVSGTEFIRRLATHLHQDQTATGEL